jgi:hypothetical protein
LNEQLELLKALDELERRQRVCPIAAFKPHPGQQTYMDVVDNKTITMILAGNRYGKTHLMVAELIAAALGYRPWLVPNFDLLKDESDKLGFAFPPRTDVPYEAWVKRADGLPIAVPGHSIFITGLDLMRGIGEIVQQKFCQLWPMNKVSFGTSVYKFGTWRKLRLPNGSEINFGSAAQDRMAFEGFAADVAFFDEPVPRYVFASVRRGLVDRQGKLAWTMTPLGDQDIAWVVADLLNGDRNDVQVINGSGRDNPYIDRAALDEFLSDPALTDMERRARTTGEVGTIGKRIVTTFEQATCVIPPTEIPPDIPRLLCVDPHHSRPPCCVWFAVFDDGERLIAYREWPTDDVEKAGPRAITNHDLAGLIKSLEGREDVKWRLCDPTFGRAHAKVLGQSFDSFVESMAAYDLHFDDRVDNDVDRGIQKLRDAFRLSSITNRPRLSIMSHLKNVQNSLLLWSYKELDSGTLKVGEKFKDFADVVRYACMYDMPTFSKGGSYSYLDEEAEDRR